jgi:ABC-type antimicrobial peptide transport system permease subunit
MIGLPQDIRYAVRQLRKTPGFLPAALLGIVMGVGLALGLTRLISEFSFGVKPTDPATYAVVALGLTVVALLACYLPARRASRVDPMVALR